MSIIILWFSIIPEEFLTAVESFRQESGSDRKVALIGKWL
jgi:hypothetical protein